MAEEIEILSDDESVTLVEIDEEMQVRWVMQRSARDARRHKARVLARLLKETHLALRLSAKEMGKSRDEMEAAQALAALI